jgi:hypothetical protein
MSSHARNTFYILLGGAFVLALSLGIRHGFGLFLLPMSSDYGWGRHVFAFAMALQNLLWGIVQPLTGAIADRYGAYRVVMAGGLLYALGLLLMGLSSTPLMLNLSAGLLIGLGLSATSFTVILGAVGRAVAPEKRSASPSTADGKRKRRSLRHQCFENALSSFIHFLARRAVQHSSDGLRRRAAAELPDIITTTQRPSWSAAEAAASDDTQGKAGEDRRAARTVTAATQNIKAIPNTKAQSWVAAAFEALAADSKPQSKAPSNCQSPSTPSVAAQLS